MKPIHFVAAAMTLAAVSVPMAAGAETWFAPNETNYSADKPTVSVEASNSDDLLVYLHPVNLEQVTAIAPDGSTLKLENPVRGRERGAFELTLAQTGTTRVVMNTSGVNGTYVVDGKTYRLDTLRRGPVPGAPQAGPPAAAPPAAGDGPAPGTPGGRPLPGVSDPAQIPAGATEIKLVQMTTRSETFITRGVPSDWKSTGSGLELLASGTAPTDVAAGEAATFKLMLDGRPAAGAEIVVAAANQRFLKAAAITKLKADANGAFTVKWPTPGFYWINATAEAPGTIPNAVRRGSYTATLMVQKP